MSQLLLLLIVQFSGKSLKINMLKHPNPFGIEIAAGILGKTKTNIPNKGKPRAIWVSKATVDLGCPSCRIVKLNEPDCYGLISG